MKMILKYSWPLMNRYDKKKLLFFTLLSALSFTLIAQTTVKGFVYEDTNRNGIKDSKEKVIPQVAVTNGIDVILSDEKGRYKIPVGQDNIIAVIKPSHFKVRLNENNLPQFFYIHKPAGSPDQIFKGVNQTGNLPKSVDFGLIPSEENDKFSALIFGDPQPYNMEEVGFFDKAIVSDLEISTENILFGLSLGDLVGNDLKLFKPYIKAVKKAGIPWYNVLGNHDLNFDAKEDQLSDETFEAHFGPANYAFNYGKVHFIVLDNILYPDPRDNNGYWGGFRKDQLKFIENNLKVVPKDYLVVLAFHIPLSEPGIGDTFRDEDRDQLFSLLKDFPHTLSLSAHTHLQRQDFFTQKDGWQRKNPHHHYNVGTTSGDWYSGTLDEKGIPISTMRDGTPKGYAFINFKGNKYTIDYKVAGKPNDYRMQIFNPKVVAKGRSTKAGIYANFFMGSEKDTLMYQIDEGDWNPMTLVKDSDPAYVKLIMEWDLSEELLAGRRSSNPVNSTHLWRGSIPVKLESGKHTIKVKAIDMFGRVFTQTSSYRLEEPKKVNN